MTTSKIIDGKAIAQKLHTCIKSYTSFLQEKYALLPRLKVILIGDNPASKVYVCNKQRTARRLGIASEVLHLTQNITQEELLKHIHILNDDSNVHGLLVQLPLPKHIEEYTIINSIHLNKDVDGFHTHSIGQLVFGRKDILVPCTPQACVYLLKEVLGQDLSGLNVTIIGRSNIVGKPLFHLLLQENCTVTITHSKTRDLASKCLQADVLIAALGRAKFIQAEWIKKGAVVIDVGINKTPHGLVGDIDYVNALSIVKAITPVPGGVGPMTIAFLLINTLLACSRSNGIQISLNDILLHKI